MSLMVKAHKASFVHHLMSIMHLIIGLMLRMNSYIIFKEGMKKNHSVIIFYSFNYSGEINLTLT